MNSIKLTGLWKGKTQVGGHEYLSGSLTATSSLQIWPNKFKRNERDPDFNLVIVQKEAKREDGANYQAAGFPSSEAPPPSPDATPQPPPPPPASSGFDYLNEIPF